MSSLRVCSRDNLCLCQTTSAKKSKIVIGSDVIIVSLAKLYTFQEKQTM